MIHVFLSFLGSFLGYFIGKSTQEELEVSKIYFRILEVVILFILVLIFLFNNFNLWVFLIGIVVAFFLKFEYLYFGLGLVSSFLSKDLTFLSSILVFIYGLPYGSLLFIEKKWIILFYNLLFFFIAFVFYFINFNILSFVSGALLCLFVLKLYKL